ncbi:MAG: hypothetical protein GY884_13090, partial [Proteobacteria bacterium]|nr:hypothetical protein [Pseudomonadota bacterium]
DSIRLSELQAGLEQRFGEKISHTELLSAQTLGDILDHFLDPSCAANEGARAWERRWRAVEPSAAPRPPAPMCLTGTVPAGAVASLVEAGLDAVEVALDDIDAAGRERAIVWCPNPLGPIDLAVSDCRRLASLSSSRPVVVLSRSAVAVETGDASSAVVGAVHAFLRVLRRERPKAAFNTVDTDDLADLGRAMAADRPELAVRNGRLLEPRPTPLQHRAGDSSSFGGRALLIGAPSEL